MGALGELLGLADGELVGAIVGFMEGEMLGEAIGLLDGDFVGSTEGEELGLADGYLVGEITGIEVTGEAVSSPDWGMVGLCVSDDGLALGRSVQFSLHEPLWQIHHPGSQTHLQVLQSQYPLRQNPTLGSSQCVCFLIEENEVSTSVSCTTDMCFQQATYWSRTYRIPPKANRAPGWI